MDGVGPYHNRSNRVGRAVSVMEHIAVGLDLGPTSDDPFRPHYFDIKFPPLQLLQVA